MKFLIALICCILPLARGGAISGRVVNGKDVTIQEFPFMVAISYDGHHHCGGSIVGPREIVTAAHCVKSVDATHFKVRVGSTYRTHGGRLIPVSHGVYNPQFNEQDADFDVAVLFLSEDLVFNDAIQPIKIATPDVEIPVGAAAYLTGWGLTSENGQDAEVLQGTPAPILSRHDCRKKFSFSQFTKNMICAGDLSTPTGMCNSDSGGPLSWNDYLVGVVSWSLGCGVKGHPGVYANVAQMSPWILETIKRGK